MTGDIQKNIVIRVDPEGNASLGRAPRGTTFDIECRVLGETGGKGEGGSSPRFLRLHGFQRLVPRMPGWVGQTAGLAVDGEGAVRMSQRLFRDADAAARFFERQRGRWLLVRILGGAATPRLAHTDPFTREAPLAGSLVAWGDGALSGPFTGERRYFVDWVLRHYRSGYYATWILERVEIVDNGPADIGDEESKDCPAPAPGQYCAFCRDADGRVRLCHAGEGAEIRAAARNRAGVWLLAEAVEAVDMH